MLSFGLSRLEGKVCWYDLGKDERFILKWILKKKDGSTWTDTSGRGWGQVMSFCDHGHGCLLRGIALLSEDQLASQDGLFWMQLVVKGNQFNDLKPVFKNFIAPPMKIFTRFQWRDCTRYLEWYWDEIHELWLIQKCGSQGDKFSLFMIYISTVWFQRADPVFVWSYFSWQKVIFKYDSRGLPVLSITVWLLQRWKKDLGQD